VTRRLARAAAGLALAAGIAWWMRSRVSAEPPSILLVTIDTLRADRVGAYGAGPGHTPTLDALAAEGVVMEDAWSSVPLTLPSHATILSGLEPPHHGVHDNGTYVFPPDPPTLATLLSARGYATGAFVGAYVLDRRFGLARGFAHYDDAIARRASGGSVLESERRAEAVASAAEAWIRAQTGRFLAWVHFYDPHAPYDPPPPWRERFAGPATKARSPTRTRPRGRDRRRPRARGPAAAGGGDGGSREGLGDHGEKTHGFFIYGATLRVPLIQAGPGVPRGQRRPGVARSVDILPTILARAGVAVPAGLPGADLLQGPRPRESYAETLYPQTLGWAPLRALRSGSLRLIEAPRPELYDLADDPGETRNRFGEQPQEAQRLRDALAALRRSERQSAAGPADSESAARLRALGYVAGAPAGSAPQVARDPKDALSLWQRLEEANWAAARGDDAAAVPVLRALLAEEPANLAFRRALSASLRKLGRSAEAATVLGEAGGDATAWHERALAQAEAGAIDEAIRSEDRARTLNPLLPEVLNHLGVMQAQKGRLNEALSAFDEAVRLDPNSVQAHTNRANALRALGRAADARDAYAAALRLDPGDADALNGLGVMAVQAGEPDRAAELFRKVLERDPSYAEARLNLAVAEARRGRVDAARAELNVILRSSAPPDVSERARRLLHDLDS
jgi:arylsulfatase A-like enzyme/Tfp pilus assembly protein PilF